MKLKETIMIAIAALAFMLITGVAKSEEKTITPQEFVNALLFTVFLLCNVTQKSW